MRLGELHAAPCGGTHVRSLGDLDEVVLPTLKVKKGRIRVSYTAAHRSLCRRRLRQAARRPAVPRPRSGRRSVCAASSAA
ncbi:hypothetical protein [Streptomyces sp. NPDC059893]|uniref:hypothetical protein n=1 Tax=Streptomyces sp. NPDC059893 TaxID=3346990 RepID=UPI00364F04F5